MTFAVHLMVDRVPVEQDVTVMQFEFSEQTQSLLDERLEASDAHLQREREKSEMKVVMYEEGGDSKQDPNSVLISK